MDSRKLLEHALRALERDKSQLDNRTQELDDQIRTIRSMLHRPGRPSAGSGKRRTRGKNRKRKPMTSAQKKLISAKMKAAWARRKKAAGAK